MVTSRKHIGIIYEPDINWIAGAYYLQNIVASLGALPSKTQPIVHVICSSKSIFDEFVQATQYKHLRFCPNHYSKLNLNIRKTARKITGIQFNNTRKYDVGLQKSVFIYPTNGSYNCGLLKDRRKALAWIPDFQEEYLPQLFSDEEINSRRNTTRFYIENKIPIVFSSQDAKNDFEKFYSTPNQHKTFILPFAVFHPDFSRLNILELKNKYNITKPYLFCANQFWVHKNHSFLFKAFLDAKQKGLDLQLVCSGKMHDYRNAAYCDELKAFINDNNLQNDILLLGFISREEQLCLMDNSYAVVQPSLFEGWSTVVEDAKRLNKFIYVSDLEVHKEQEPVNASFFNPHDTADLVDKLLNVSPTNKPYDYTMSVKRCAEAFNNIINRF